MIRSKIFCPVSFRIVNFLIVVGFGCTEYAWARPASTSDRDEIVKEWTARRIEIQKQARSEKVLNLKKLKSEKDPQKLNRAISSLGDTGDEDVVDPLLEVLDDPLKDEKCRIQSIDSMLRIATSPSRTKGATHKILTGAKPHVSLALKSDSTNLRRMAALFLYRVGDKKGASPILIQALKDGEWGFLNTFVYHRLEDSVQVFGAMPGEEQRVDPDAGPVLQKAAEKEFPEPVRYRASLMLLKLGETEKALAALEDIIIRGTDLGLRSSALSSVADVGGKRAHDILVKAQDIDELRSLAKRMLMRKR